MSRTLLLIAALSATPVLAQGPIDIQQLKQTTLSQVLPPSMHRLAGIGQAVDPVATSWGLEFGAMPELYRRLPELQNGVGMYVSRVAPGSPSAQAGLVAGHVVLAFNGQPITNPQTLGYLQQATKLTVLTMHGPQEVAVQPPESHVPSFDLVRGAAAFSNTGVASTARSFASSTPGSSVAVSMANGQYKIEASVPTASGPQQVRLEGTADEVNKQLDKLPANVANAVRSQL